MIALLSVWLGSACFITAVVMWLWRPAMTDLTVWAILWLGAPGTMCLAGLVLWSLRHESARAHGVRPQRLQCAVAITLAAAAATIVYALIINAQEVPLGLLRRAG